MPASHSPTARRRRLATELRKMRESAGMTCEQVADALECSPSKISRMETGQVSIHPRDVRELLALYRAGEQETAALIAVAREARKRGWWHEYFGVLPKLHLTFIGLEAEAGRIRTYQPQLVPGLLQTEEYARALTRRAVFRRDPDDTEMFVAARLQRQRRLLEDDAFALWAVLDEAVIRRVVGGPAVMRPQLAHLLLMAERPTVTVQVVPFPAGAHPAMEGPFTILDFTDSADPDLVYLENLASSLYLEQEEEIALYGKIFEHTVASALGPEDSANLLREAITALE
jgi:transcriptional regulator with XRE-family HTH domain